MLGWPALRLAGPAGYLALAAGRPLRRRPSLRAVTAALVLALLLAGFGAWPLAWRAYVLPSANRQNRSFRVEAFANAPRGRPIGVVHTATSEFGPACAATRAYALWDVPRAGIYGVRLEGEESTRLSVDRREVPCGPDERRAPWILRVEGARFGSVALAAGLHLVAIEAGGGDSPQVRATFSAPGLYDYAPLGGEALVGLDADRLADLCRALRVSDALGLAGLALAFVSFPTLSGRPFCAFWGRAARQPARAATAALFAGFLVLPAFQTWYGWPYSAPQDENRAPAPVPYDFQKRLFRTDGFLAADFERYYNDRYGLREAAVRLKNRIDYALFRHSDRVHFGDGGMMEYRAVMDGNEVGTERGGEARLNLVCDSTLRLRDALKARGIRLVVVSCPMKNTVYPERFRDGVPRRPAETFFDKYRRFLDVCPDLVHVDALPMLARMKGDFPTYHLTDFHWNDLAGFAVAKETVERIAAWEGRGPVWTHPPKRLDVPMNWGGLATSLGFAHPFAEESLWVEQTWNVPGRLVMAPGAPFEAAYTDATGKGELLPETILYGNSFSEAFIRTGAFVYFKALCRARTDNASWPEVLGAGPLKCRYVIYQCLEDRIAAHEFSGLDALERGPVTPK